MTGTPPLTPGDCDLQDFKFMPLDVARLRDSDLASDESPEVCWAAVLLWCASWHQVPAASVPDNDAWLAKQAGYVARGKIAKEWVTVRPGALRGFVMCTDGRMYHPVVAEKAVEAWNSKLDQRWRTEVARVKKHNDRHGTHIARPSFEDWIAAGCPQGHRLPVPGDNGDLSQGTTPLRPSNVPRETPSKGQEQGQGQFLNTEEPTVLVDGEETPFNLSPDPAGPKTRPPCPAERLLELFHETFPELPKVLALSDTRRKHLAARWREVDKAENFTSTQDGIEVFRGLWQSAAASDFLMGRTTPGPGRKPFKASFDWLVSPQNFLKVAEGNYDNNRSR